MPDSSIRSCSMNPSPPSRIVSRACNRSMAPPLASADQALGAAANQVLALDRTAAAHSLAEAGKQIAALRDRIASQNGDDKAAALYEVDQVREKIDRALTDVVSLSIAVNADRMSWWRARVLRKCEFSRQAGRGGGICGGFRDQRWKCLRDGPFRPKPAKQPNAGYRFNISVPAGAVPPSSPEDAILPFPPALVTLAVPVHFDGYGFTVRRTIEFSQTKTTGIETYPLELVPAVTLTVEPAEMMVPEKHAAAPVKLFARVRYHGTQAAKVSVGIDAPKGWNVQPVAPLDFTEAGRPARPLRDHAAGHAACGRLPVASLCKAWR